MKKILILLVFLMISVACGSKTVEIGDPDFSDNESNADTDTAADSDGVVPDDDSVIIPDDDSTVDPDDDSTVIPDDDTVVFCVVGEKKCDDDKQNVLECDATQNWIVSEDCTDPLKMCVENPVGTFYCDTLTCEPGVKFCKNEDVYTCNEDGKNNVLSTNCTDLQYCDTTTNPVSCQDMICDPDQLFCDGNVLSRCNSNGGGASIVENCATNEAVCDNGLKECVYTGELGGVYKFDRTGKRGNFFNCTKDVTVVSFAQEFEFSGSKNLSWEIFEDTDNDNIYQRIFVKSSSVTGTGKLYYSTGNISVELKNGSRYIFIASWNDTITVIYHSDTVTLSPVNVGFGTSFAGFSSGPDTSETISSPFLYDKILFNQKIQFIAE